MAFPAGKIGYVMIDTADEWAFKGWRYKPRAKIISRNNFRSGGKDQSATGFIGGDITLSGPFETPPPANLTVGEVYQVTLGIDEDGPYEFTVPVKIADIELDNDAEEAPNWVVSGVTEGDFEPAILQS